MFICPGEMIQSFVTLKETHLDLSTLPGPGTDYRLDSIHLNTDLYSGDSEVNVLLLPGN